MSLLVDYTGRSFIEVTQFVFQALLACGPTSDVPISDDEKRLLYDEVTFAMSFLMTSVYFSDEKIFASYAKWTYERSCSLQEDAQRDKLMSLLAARFSAMADALGDKQLTAIDSQAFAKAITYLQRAIATMTADVVGNQLSSSFLLGRHYEIRRAYLDALLSGKTAQAYEVIAAAKKQGLPLKQIYEEILAKVMYEIGELWKHGVISVDKEHYATAVTQMVMAGFYDEIFATARRNRTLIACAVGSELHELGIRMVADIFEQQGWDTYYLGAALPPDALLRAIEEHKPELIALSVTMPPYLAIGEYIVKTIRTQYPDVKIAVGGQAFHNTSELWRKWPVDFYAVTAEEFACWANTSFAQAR